MRRKDVVMGFGGAPHKRDADARPWVPPWWFSFDILPLMVIATFYLSQVTGWQGVASSDEEGVPWNEVTSDGLVPYVGGFLAFYFALVAPIFLIRRYLWDKQHQQDA